MMLDDADVAGNWTRSVGSVRQLGGGSLAGARMWTLFVAHLKVQDLSAMAFIYTRKPPNSNTDCAV